MSVTGRKRKRKKENGEREKKPGYMCLRLRLLAPRARTTISASTGLHTYLPSDLDRFTRTPCLVGLVCLQQLAGPSNDGPQHDDLSCRRGLRTGQVWSKAMRWLPRGQTPCEGLGCPRHACAVDIANIGGGGDEGDLSQQQQRQRHLHLRPGVEEEATPLGVAVVSIIPSNHLGPACVDCATGAGLAHLVLGLRRRCR